MNDARQIINQVNGRLISKPGVGLNLQADDGKREKLRECIRVKVDHSYFYYFRKKHILDVLFSNTDGYPIQLFADDLYTGKNTIMKDLEKIKQWLAHFYVKIDKRRHCGIFLSGKESDIRQALLEHNRNYAFKSNSDDESEYSTKGLDYRISESFYKYLVSEYKDSNIMELQNSLLCLEEKLGIIYTDSYFGRLIEYLAVTNYRIKRGCVIEEVYFSNCKDILTIPEYEVAEKLFKKLKISKNKLEIENFTAYLLALKPETSFAPISEEEKNDYNALRRFAGSVGKIFKISLENDNELLSSLFCCLKRFRLCNKYGIRMRTAFSGRIKKDNPTIFAVCVSAAPEIEQQLGFVLNESEIAEIALLIYNAMESCNKPITAVFVTASDYNTSRYIANRILNFIPELKFSRIIMYNDKFDIDRSSYRGEIIISTVSLNISPFVLISKNINTSDIGKIQEAIYKRQQKDSADYYRKLFERIFNKNAIVTKCKLKTRDKIIERGCEMLQNIGKTDEKFCLSAKNREIISSTAIGNGVAIPHGQQAFIKQSGIAVLQLEKPIDWTDEDKVDIVFVLALKFERKSSLLEFFGKFYSIVDNEKILKKLEQVKSKDELWDCLISLF